MAKHCIEVVFSPEDGESMFSQNLICLQFYTALQPRTPISMCHYSNYVNIQTSFIIIHDESVSSDFCVQDRCSIPCKGRVFSVDRLSLGQFWSVLFQIQK